MILNKDWSASEWLKQIEKVCTQRNFSLVNIILDQAGCSLSLVEDLKRFQPRIDWISLLENEPENEFIEDAPLFFQLKVNIWQQKEWLSAVLRQYDDPARILLFFSACDFGFLAKHLKRLVIAEWEGRKGLMRFYDARIFPTLVGTILSETQKKCFLQIAQYWSWRNRDRKPVWLQGDDNYNDFNITEVVSLTDIQYSQLGVISDIEMFISRNYMRYPGFTRQALFRYLWEGVQSAGEDRFMDNDVFFVDYLSRNEL